MILETTICLFVKTIHQQCTSLSFISQACLSPLLVQQKTEPRKSTNLLGIPNKCHQVLVQPSTHYKLSKESLVPLLP